jgi:hypothetical protein
MAKRILLWGFFIIIAIRAGWGAIGELRTPSPVAEMVGTEAAIRGHLAFVAIGVIGLWAMWKGK